MSSIFIGFLGIGLALALISIRVPIGLSLAMVAIGGIATLVNVDVAYSMLGHTAYDTVASWELSAIPMFLLMGGFAFHSGLTTSLFDAARLWLSWLPGGLAVSTNFACAGFAAASGSSLATTVTMGRIALPEMKRYGYDDGLACGVVASAGTLGSLIPPSVIMILIGIFSEVSILTLFVAAVIPGILTALVFASVVIVRVLLNPNLAPSISVDANWSQRFKALSSTWPLPALVLSVIGALYAGIVTPTQAGAFGAALTLVLAVVRRQMTWSKFKAAVVETLTATAAIFFIVIGAVLLAKFMTFSGLPDYISEIMASSGVNPLVVIAIVIGIYLVLGMFLDPMGVLFITLPVLIPVFREVQLDMVLMGVLIVKLIEIGLMTPPVGLNVFAVKGLVPDVPLKVIYKGVAWFLIADLLLIVVMVIFPDITLALPRMLGV
ncbi:C4-dicarboxylate ABC transporter [Pusillimonas sp. T2]|uniref:TRAP transporter large permease n=1 Tax=Pusillimonas sp. T2 TaxID=1548123 RepID=UPI000B8AC7B1|nr:TRAP transporter large permease subunit [Pusillimonas sp. T2]OXR48085.1 C4-dicarboxylate ABC transporter [Pusillimonas sp. T2]